MWTLSCKRDNNDADGYIIVGDNDNDKSGTVFSVFIRNVTE